MTDGFSGAESALSLSQSKAERVKHSYSYGFRVLTRLSGKGDVLCVLNVMGIRSCFKTFQVSARQGINR